MKTLRITESSRRIKRSVAWAFVALLIGTIIAGFLFELQWSALLLGLITSAVIMYTTIFTTQKMAASEDWSVGWIGFDYAVKVVSAAGAILLAKYVFALNIRIVGFVIIAAVCITLLAQVGALLNRQATQFE